MVDTQQLQEIRRENEQAQRRLEEQRRRMSSQQALRQSTSIETLRQRNAQLQRLGQAESQVRAQAADIRRVEGEIRQRDAEQERINRINSVIERSFRKGSVGGEFQKLSKEDRKFVTDTIRRIENSGERNAVARLSSQVISNIESSRNRSLAPQERAAVVEQVKEQLRATPSSQVLQPTAREQLLNQSLATGRDLSSENGERPLVLTRFGFFEGDRQSPNITRIQNPIDRSANTTNSTAKATSLAPLATISFSKDGTMNLIQNSKAANLSKLGLIAYRDYILRERPIYKAYGYLGSQFDQQSTNIQGVTAIRKEEFRQLINRIYPKNPELAEALARLGGTGIGVAGDTLASFSKGLGTGIEYLDPNKSVNLFFLPREQQIQEAKDIGYNIVLPLATEGLGRAGAPIIRKAFGIFSNPLFESKVAVNAVRPTELTLVAGTNPPRIIKPELSLGFEISDVVQTAPDEFFVRSTGKADVFDARTRKPLNTLQSEGASAVKVIQLEDGSFQAVGETDAALIGKRGTRNVGNEVRQKFDVFRARGTGAMAADELGIFRGSADTSIIDLGVFRTRGTPSGVTGDFASKKLQARSTALSNIGAREIATTPREVGFDGLNIQGRQQTFRTGALTDVYPETVKVRGFTRKDKVKVPSYLREVRRDVRKPLASRDVTAGRSSVFTPERVDIEFTGFDSPDELAQEALKLARSPKEAVAIAVARAQQQSILQSAAPRVVRSSSKPGVATLVEPNPRPTTPRFAMGAYAGQGLYERTESVLSPTNIVAPKGALIPKEREQLVFRPGEGIRSAQGQSSAQAESLDLDNRQLNVLKFGNIPSQINPPSQRQPQQPRQDTPQVPALGQASRLKLLTRQDSRTDQNMRPTPRVTPPFRPKIPQSRSSRILALKEKILAARAAAYDVFIRKAGKRVKIASALPIGKAQKAGVKRNLSDISASFETEEVGTTAEADIRFNVPKELFRPSKTRANTFVQRRGGREGGRGRLSSFGEIRDIMRSRRAGKKVKWW